MILRQTSTQHLLLCGYTVPRFDSLVLKTVHHALSKVQSEHSDNIDDQNISVAKKEELVNCATVPYHVSVILAAASKTASSTRIN